MNKLKLKFNQWRYKRFTKCDFCGNNLFRFGNCHGGIDVKENISGTKKHTAYVCNLCYHLFNK